MIYFQNSQHRQVQRSGRGGGSGGGGEIPAGDSPNRAWKPFYITKTISTTRSRLARPYLYTSRQAGEAGHRIPAGVYRLDRRDKGRTRAIFTCRKSCKEEDDFVELSFMPGSRD